MGKSSGSELVELRMCIRMLPSETCSDPNADRGSKQYKNKTRALIVLVSS